MNFGPLRPLTDAPGVGDGGGLANERWGANRRMEDEAAAMTTHARDRGPLAGRSTLSAAASSGSASDENPLPTAPFRWTPQAGAIGPDRRLAAPATTRSGSACGRSSGANRKEESQNCARPTSCHVTSELASGLGQRPSFLTAFLSAEQCRLHFAGRTMCSRQKLAYRGLSPSHRRAKDQAGPRS